MNVDVQNRCRPRDVSWRHLTPVSAICHLVILFIWFKGMPENNSWMEDVIQSPATTRTVLVSPIVNAQDAVQFDAPEAVSADEKNADKASKINKAADLNNIAGKSIISSII